MSSFSFPLLSEREICACLCELNLPSLDKTKVEGCISKPDAETVQLIMEHVLDLTHAHSRSHAHSPAPAPAPAISQAPALSAHRPRPVGHLDARLCGHGGRADGLPGAARRVHSGRQSVHPSLQTAPRQWRARLQHAGPHQARSGAPPEVLVGRDQPRKVPRREARRLHLPARPPRGAHRRA